MTSQNILTLIGIVLATLSSIVTVVSSPDVSRAPKQLVEGNQRLQANADRVHEMLHLTQ